MIPTRKTRRDGYAPLRSGPTTPPQPIENGPITTNTGNQRKPSPFIETRRASSAPRAALNAALAQSTAPARQKDKFVPLPDDRDEGKKHSQGPEEDLEPIRPLAIFEDISQEEQTPTTRGRITVVCGAESFNRTSLEQVLKDRYFQHTIHPYAEVVHASAGMQPLAGDIFFFDYGVVVFWGMTRAEEQEIIRNVIAVCQRDPLPVKEVEVDEFEYNYSILEPPHIQNDVITINQRFAKDHQVKLAISHGLAQSTKLSIYEQRIMDVVLQTKHLPEHLARDGKVKISRTQIAKLIGEVFLQRSAVTLLSSVMDTPEFFWSSPDQLQVIYKRVCEYLELDTRVEVLNTRFSVLQDMLDMLRDHQNNKHMSRLEWIVIWLIVVEVLVGLLEVAGLVGWFHPAGEP